MKRRLDQHPSQEVTKDSVHASAEPLFLRPAPPCPRWACLAQDLGATRFLAAVVCVDTLAICSLQVVDKALSASAAGMDSLRASASAAATALFAAYLQDECVGCASPPRRPRLELQ